MELIDYDGDGKTDVLLLNCQPGLTRCDVRVRTSPSTMTASDVTGFTVNAVDITDFTEIATDVTVLLAFAIPQSSAQPSVGTKLLWDADEDGHPDGGAILIDFDRDGDFGEEREIRVFGED